VKTTLNKALWDLFSLTLYQSQIAKSVTGMSLFNLYKMNGVITDTKQELIRR